MDGIAPAAWSALLLPFLRKRIAAMQMSGVSGLPLEQELISLLREGVRVFYLASGAQLGAPSAELGHAMFDCVVEAIRHGYIETERFTECAAKVRTRLAPDLALRFVPAASGDANMTRAGFAVGAPPRDPSHSRNASASWPADHLLPPRRRVHELGAGRQSS